MRFRRSMLAFLATAALVSSTLLFAGPAHAAAGAYLRLAHLSPDTPNVDVYVASVSTPDKWIMVPGVGYGVVSDYRLVEPGDYTISMRPAGAASSTAPLLSTTLSAKSGSAYTVAGLGFFAGVSLKILTDDLSLPDPGQARVRVVHASATAQKLDVGIVGGPVVATGVAFGEPTDYRTAPAGNWNMLVTPAGKTPVTLPCTLAANSVYTVLVVDKGGTLATELRTDAKAGASGPIPVGAIETGMGGTADTPVGVLALGTVVASAVLCGLVTSRIRRRESAI